MIAFDSLHEAEMQRARSTGILLSTAPRRHVVYRRWSDECGEAHRADLVVRIMARTLYVDGDTLPTERCLDADGGAWIAEIAPKTGWAFKGYAFNGATRFDFLVPRRRLDEVVIALQCIARGEGTRPILRGAERPVDQLIAFPGRPLS